MKITIKSHTKNIDNTTIKYLIERENQTYNNIVETVILSNIEIEGLSENEIKTLGFKRIKPTAIRVFEQIEPLNESDTPIDFELVSSVPKSIIVQGSDALAIGQTSEYSAIVYDQYNMPLETELTWTNKIVNASGIGIVKVTASVGNMTSSMDVNIIARVKTEMELLQSDIDEIYAQFLKVQGVAINV